MTPPKPVHSDDPALYAALANPGVFSAVATQSGEYEEAVRAKLMGLVTDASKDLRIIMEWGAFEPVVDTRVDVPGWNKALIAQFTQKGLKVESKVLPMGEEWGNWRTRHDDLLQMLFPLENCNRANMIKIGEGARSASAFLPTSPTHIESPPS